ncbi:FAD-dependent oxidoreductase [Mesorhizobium sp. BAC0120]|uniref:NAD(P)/FAD-dependent oxidoreductase n=1 Tax=Mesorhizobium sp. BAC0120 TaxID=3090670 RepID=UPI00298D3616|nr:FAD-dependent oxidoreductase [Mesorhizobium sp. BAC0120]MDW6025841.1 FAD-dependent oxidoreductase [Mesorhizobium sp. BAC0120]
MPPTSFSEPVWQRPAQASFHTPLEHGEESDVAIVGAGILGLSTGLHAARYGLSVRIVEAKGLGEGASGLNGGQVIPGLKYDPDKLLELFGEARGEALVGFAASTADKVFGLIRDEKLDVPYCRNGWIHAAHTGTALRAAESRDRQWRARGADAVLLDAAEIARLTGAKTYLGGWLDRRAGTIDPLSFTLELARIASAAGVRIAGNTRARALRSEAGLWRLTTEAGMELRAKSLVVATNAYTDALIPGLAETIVPLHSFQIATARLSPDRLETILPGGHAVSDSRRILVYYRRGPDGRLVLGGRGRMAPPRSPKDWLHLERAMLRLYPALSGVPIEKRWFGRVAMTPDHLPHVHEPQPRLLAVVGCQGRGVGLMTALGERIAAYLAGGDPKSIPFPLTPVRPIPLHGFRQIGVAAASTWYRMLDAFER